MKCIIGLGNPGRKYKRTRHNIGFMVVDELLTRHKWKLSHQKFNGNYTLEYYDGVQVLLLQPQTFMNLSGEAIKGLVNYYHINIEDLLVIYDDLDLPIGKIRLRETGGHGGHNGIRSIIDHLGTKAFKRIRIGIGRPTSRIPVVNYVLSPFAKDEREDVRLSILTAADACEDWLKTSFQETMNKYN